MKTSILSYFSLLLVAVMFFSCEADTKAKLEGTWKVLQVPAGVYEEAWTFTDNAIILTRQNTGDTAVVFASGTYSIKNNTITTTGEGLAGAGADYYRGDFQIRSLDKTQMVLIRKDLGMQYYEFEKKQ
ncbi:MAG: hypothetical protein NT150_13155 [Bacteroidetes bacterium]|nr:hypothetical protein [Bacteroidota bacterium]